MEDTLDVGCLLVFLANVRGKMLPEYGVELPALRPNLLADPCATMHMFGSR